MESQEFQTLMTQKIMRIEDLLKGYLPKEEGYQKLIMEAMNYSMLAGGKRLRPLFLQETYEMFGGKGAKIGPFMAAIEMIHTYSLVHDDLPAMDNDEYRRGRETTWKVYGNAMGVLTGDALLNYAFETALSSFSKAKETDIPRLANALQVLAKKAGIYGMVGGQVVDVESETNGALLDMDKIMFIHKLKTAALIEASMMMGAILAGATEEQVLKIEKCAYNVGIAFQIQDDILDVTGSSEELGKQVGSDEKNNKKTYVTIQGLEQSKKAVETLSQEAISILQELPGEKAFLEQLVIHLIYRTK